MSLTILEKTIFKHASRGILVDTNLLLLFLIGIFGKNHIEEFKKTQKYGFTDLSILESAKVSKCLVFTDDFQLVGFLRKKRVVVINLNEIRTELWFK